MRTIQQAYEERERVTEYVAFGFDHELIGPPGFDWWLAGWADDGPTTPEVYAKTRDEAERLAQTLAAMVGVGAERFVEPVPAVEVDEFGAVA